MSTLRYFRFRDRFVTLGQKTYIMGILNVTPDSFSDGGKHFSLDNALTAAIAMEKAGADFLDIGGQSTRPGATLISKDEEWRRLEPVLNSVLKAVNIPVSVDTFYPEVAGRALSAGAHIINDVSGKVSEDMAKAVKKYSAGYILMHNSPITSKEVCLEVNKELWRLKNDALKLGVSNEYICLDPGIGFNKTAEQGLALIKDTAKVKVNENAYLLAASRKSLIAYGAGYDILPENRDPGTNALNAVGILGGADIIRVHSVKSALQTARVIDKMKGLNVNE